MNYFTGEGWGMRYYFWWNAISLDICSIIDKSIFIIWTTIINTDAGYLHYWHYLRI